MTTFLSDAQLARMRAQALKMMPDTAIIQANTRSRSARGGFDDVWAPVTGGTVVCRLDPLVSRGGIEIVARTEAQRNEFILTLPYNAPISVGNRVEIASVDYEVRQLHDVHSWNVSVRAQVSRLVPGSS